MPRTGRPRALNENLRTQVCTLLALGTTLRQAARMIGCAPCTLRREALRNPEFHKALEIAKQGFERSLLGAMIDHAAARPDAAEWLSRHLVVSDDVDPYSDPPYGSAELVLPPLPAARARKSRDTFARSVP